ncbi:MAG: reverse transcriptase-like protein [Bacteroidales bacterium]|nr:reverse transcriptase-like protein [Bacteroidales bacterium]
MKVYAVKKGHQTGIFDNWADCQVATKGFSGPEFKSFTTREEAEAYLEDRDVWVEQVAKDNGEGYLVAFTDGSYDKDLKRYSYGVEFIKPDGSEDDICGYGSNREYIDSNNIIGEIFGVINALDWAISNEYEKIKIYHDYEGLSKWISGEWSANSKVAKMYTKLYELKFKDFLEVQFKKVPGHSNVIYNEKADQLAKSALVDRKKVAIQGDNWFSIPYFKQDDFNVFVELIEESDEGITHSVTPAFDKDIYKFKLNREVVTVTLFKTGKQKLLLQGKNSYLFQVITATIIELYDDSKVEQILGNAYRINIKTDVVSKAYNPIESGLPNNYPVGLKRLIKQAIINMTHYVESEEYSMYAFSALRALEGHIKFLITEVGGNPGRQFGCFGYDRTMLPNRYVVTESFPDSSKNSSIEKCYNYYKSQRDTVFHFGDIIGSTDNTRLIETKGEADEIIKGCLSLISTEQ